MMSKYSISELLKMLRKLNIPFLDVRDVNDYTRYRLEHSCNIPISQLHTRSFELPPRHIPFAIVYETQSKDSLIGFFGSRDVSWSIAALICADKPSESYHHRNLLYTQLLDFTDSNQNNLLNTIENGQIQEINENTTFEVKSNNSNLDISLSDVFKPSSGKRFRRNYDYSNDNSSIENPDVKNSHENITDNTKPSKSSKSSSDITNCPVEELLDKLNMIQVSLEEDLVYLNENTDENTDENDRDKLLKLAEELNLDLYRGEPAHSITLFYPCTPLRFHLDRIENALIDSKKGVILDKNHYFNQPNSDFTSTSSTLENTSTFSSTIEQNTSNSDTPVRLDVLDLGCGHARDSLYLAKRHQHSKDKIPKYRWYITAVDEVRDILRTVSQTVHQHDVADSIQLCRTKIVEQKLKKLHVYKATYTEGGEKIDSNINNLNNSDNITQNTTSEKPSDENISVEFKYNDVKFNHKALVLPSIFTIPNTNSSHPVQNNDNSDNHAIPTNHNTNPTLEWEKQQYDMVLCARFHVPSLLPHLASFVKPNGFLVYHHFAKGCEHPANVVNPQELRTVLGDDWEVWIDELEILGDLRPVNNFIARKVR